MIGNNLFPVLFCSSSELSDTIEQLVVFFHELLAVLLHAGRNHARLVQRLVNVFKVLVGERIGVDASVP